MRILTLNMHKGRDARGQLVPLEHVAAALASTQADVVLLQEAFHEANDGGAQQSADLARLLDMHVAYVPNKQRRIGHHGNATLSRWPIAASNHIDLSTNRVERRGLIHTVLEAPAGPPVHVLNTHLGLNTLQRRRQLGRIERFIETHIPRRAALALGGDFNDWTSGLAPTIRRRLHVRDVLRGAPWKQRCTYPVGTPRLPLDRVYVRRFHVREAVVLCGSPWTAISDHLPLQVDVVPRPLVRPRHGTPR